MFKLTIATLEIGGQTNFCPPIPVVLIVITMLLHVS